MLEFRELDADDIEVRVATITEKGCQLLLYKTARTDQAILDETVGPFGWCDRYHEIKGNLYCAIGIHNDETNEWVFKEDCGIESRGDDGNEKKGEASDAFKRAGTKWGIGRELYTSPFIWVRVPTVEKNGKWYLKDRYARFEVDKIAYVDKRIAAIVIVDNKGEVVFNLGHPVTTSNDEDIKKIRDAAKQNPVTPIPAGESPFKKATTEALKRILNAAGKDAIKAKDAIAVFGYERGEDVLASDVEKILAYLTGEELPWEEGRE